MSPRYSVRVGCHLMCTAPSIRREDAPLSAARAVSSRFAVALFLSSVSLFGAQQLRAQSDDSQNNQDVAEAARQERARKQDSSKKHIYTNEDLRRGKILTPKDQTRAAAKRKQPISPTTNPDAEPLDANSNTPQESLGDVARRYRNARRNSENTSPFHLPPQQPELAAPKIFAPTPELKPNMQPQPQPPARNFPAVKPFAPISRIPTFTRPSLPSSRPHRVDPFSRHRIERARPSTSGLRPAESRTAVQPNLASPKSASLFRSRSTSPTTAQSIIVREGDTLWTLSRQHLGHGTRWLELMAANPTVADPTHLMPGTALTLPPRSVTHRVKAQTITVQAGDSLSKIALARYEHAAAWPCIANANPALSNPHRLAVGQTLTLPSSCTP